MNRLLPVLVCCLARVAAAQVSPTAQSNDASAYEPQNVHMKGDGRCVTVRPGDTVHYTLTIEGVDDVRTVYGDLRLRPAHSHELTHGGLPVPDFRSLGGGGLGTHDPGEGKIFHFAFQVPHEIYGGTYRGVEVSVRSDVPQPPAYQRSYGLIGDGTPRERGQKVEITRRTRDAVHAYCLNVFSNFGVFVEGRPAVTNFQPGPVDPPAPPPPAPSPAQPLPTPSPRPVPQPR